MMAKYINQNVVEQSFSSYLFTFYSKLLDAFGFYMFYFTTHLSMFVDDASIESISVGESLGPSTFSHTDNSVLLWMKDSALIRRKKEDRTFLIYNANRKVVISTQKNFSVLIVS